jgi:HEAT repeat protein
MKMNRREFIVTSLSLALVGLANAGAPAASLKLSGEVRSQCMEILERSLEDESPTVRVHAAEALIALHRPEPALKVFREQRDAQAPITRILVWRVLAAAEPEATRRQKYLARIRSVLLDPQATDRTHAMEALAKLNEPAENDAERREVASIAHGKDPAAPFALWRLAQAGDRDAVSSLAKRVESDESVTRLRAIYVLGRLRAKFPSAADALTAELEREQSHPPVSPMLQAAVGGSAARSLISDTKAPAADRYFAVMSLATSGSAQDFPLLVTLLSETSADLRLSAAYALLKIDADGSATAPTSAPQH